MQAPEIEFEYKVRCRLDKWVRVQAEAQARYDALQPNGPNGAAPSSATDGAVAVGDGGGGLTLESVGLKLLSDLEGLKVAELKVICKQCGVKVSGKKADLQVGRVCNFTSKIHIETDTSTVHRLCLQE